MTKIYNDPADFSGEALSGFASAFPRYVQQVPGGLVRAGPLSPGRVAVVVGGGTGHYPAFAGWVGPGMADGAVVGDVFASPSAQQIVSVALAADAGGGIFLSYGNYAGDVLNFNAARDQLIAAGVPTRSVVVTDDLASAPPEDRPLRRGTAGDLIVVKVAAAAAGAGYDLDGVAAVADRVNRRTSSLSVAFSGCTPPGSAAPLFTLAPGQMAVGLGLHGEPGISEGPLLSAADLAELLVSRVLVERPESATQAAVLVNGLGATRYEELFLLWHEVAPRLEAAGVEVVDPEVGELVTSLDMAGVSLTIGWLDDETCALWCAPANSPAYRKIAMEPVPAARPIQPPVARAIPAASEASRLIAKSIVAAMESTAESLAEHEAELNQLDAVAGNGDHGRVMLRGARAAAAAAQRAVADDAGAATTLLLAADAWSDRAGGTSGALWGAGLRAGARVMSDETISPDTATIALRAALDAVTAYGNARLGDKTLVDAFLPFVDSFDDDMQAGLPLGAAWVNAADAAARSADATASLTPRLGRARPLAARSLGHADPGAVSFAIAMAAVSEHFA
ncbi:dihydroxyacetone kinase family protein [Mycobacterium sp.]|jgi:dihydroxyacetone kinase|uniref:dihydroxyacetone kinase family protein n=1 Tax=Mycobacterium sp. TaxID=1785 RepID=UPI002D1CC9BB|nr:dihydroxyacetone kinase family protein [Mycobacterium sp.]HTH91869.1 dihydroxyacetone kinase family protein [Mycobacterium sp.]